ncbi:MAG: response regulator [Deltaproteobacteria bacterium]|nr:response regulator [Deltaproteobacteria bacterium]
MYKTNQTLDPVIRPRIMIVEDEFIFASYLQHHLEGLGYEVFANVTSAEEALRLLAENQADLVMMDILLQGNMNGIEAAEVIRDEWGVPIVFLTAYADTDILERAKLTYPFGYLLKPVNTRDLKITVEMALYVWKLDTARRKAEENRRLSEEKFRHIIESTPMGMHFYHLESDGRLIFTGANPSADRIMGIRYQNLIGKTIGEVFPFLIKMDILAICREVAAGRLCTQSLESDYNDYGTYRYFEVWIFQTSHNNIAVEFTEVTARKKAENDLLKLNRQLEQSSRNFKNMAVKAEHATMAKSLFLANMSHEIRTPLNAILGFSQLMRDDQELSFRQKTRIETINRNGEHLLTLLNDILDLSKIESGHLNLDPLCFDLHSLLTDLVSLFRPRANAKRLIFDVEGIDRLEKYIVSDAKKLRQVLLNVLVNAVKFTNAGGIRLRVWSEPAIQGETETVLLVFLVEDTGPGIKKEDLDTIFEPFAQTSLGRTKTEGTGLGLAISRQFARLMGGDLTVTSEFAKGSTFRLETKAEIGSADQMPENFPGKSVVQLENHQPSSKILVVEDDEDNRLLVVQELERVGFKVEEAKNGVETLAKFLNWKPHLIIMDQQMPVMNGDEAIKKIRQYPRGGQVKIIMLSADATDENRNKAIRAGADDFMTKPVSLTLLLEKIRISIGVEYIYAEPDGKEKILSGSLLSLNREMLAVLPPELRQEIYESAIRSRHDRLLELTQKVAAIDPEMSRALRSLIAEFDYETLFQLFSLGE